MGAPSFSATAVTDALGSLAYYAGWTLLGKGMITGMYGLSGCVYHGMKGAETYIYSKTMSLDEATQKNVDAELTRSWVEIKKHLRLAAPGVAMVVLGLGARYLGAAAQGTEVHSFVNRFTYKA